MGFVFILKDFLKHVDTLDMIQQYSLEHPRY